jgi:hypothetical protein
MVGLLNYAKQIDWQSMSGVTRPLSRRGEEFKVVHSPVNYAQTADLSKATIPYIHHWYTVDGGPDAINLLQRNGFINEYLVQFPGSEQLIRIIQNILYTEPDLSKRLFKIKNVIDLEIKYRKLITLTNSKEQ